MKKHTNIAMRKALLPLAIAAVSLNVQAQEQGDAVQLSKMVVSAAGFEQKLVEAPASISVISAEELRSRPYTSLLDAVRYLEGVDIGETNDKTGQGTISIRGMGSDYTLVLINGRRQNNHGDIYPNSFGGNQFGNIPPLDAIERIEVIRGPASTLYGADAIGGVINIITKAVGDQWGGSVSHGRTFQSDNSYGNDITTDFTASGPLIDDVLGLSVRGSMYNKLESNPTYETITDPDGNEVSRSLGFGGGGKTVDNENTSFGATLSWSPAKNQKVFFDVDSYKQKYDNRTRINDEGEAEYPLGSADSIDTIWRLSGWCDGFTPSSGGNQSAKCTTGGGTWNKRADPRVGYAEEQEFTRDTMSITHNGEWNFGNSFISLQRVTTSNNGRTLPFTVAERSLLLEMHEGTGAYAGLSEAARKEAAENAFLPRPKRVMESDQYVLDVKVDMPFELAGQHTAVVGGQVIQGELTDSVFGIESGNPGEVKEHNMWSVFAEDTWYVLSPLAVTAGLRYDNHEDFGDNVSPRLYAVYNLTDSLTVKGGVSTGFKTPKTTDLYDGVVGFGGQGTSPMFGNPDLEPEISTSTELAVYWEDAADGHGFNVTYFQNKFKDKISSQECGGATGISCSSAGDYAALGYASSSKAVNIDEVELKGVEVAGNVQILDDLSLRANYTYTDSEQKSGQYAGYPLNGTAKHMLNTTLDYQLSEVFGLFLTLESRDKRFRGFGRSGLNTGKNGARYYKKYEVLHLGASYRLADNVTLNARVNNLLDEDFTSYEVDFAADGSGGYDVTYYDDYNNKDKRRNYWLNLNVTF
ncbi:TonB-dependent receptor [Oceanospirillaceae bacterium ASx5O]|nr:TonB-dependent receptor [Oceanospirillaceae bacterium ASx5O]